MIQAILAGVRRVKGILFADYVRMIRANKTVAWKNELPPQDHVFLEQTIEANHWYPMESFERMGNAILEHNAGGSVEAVRMWGRLSVAPLLAANPTLLATGNPVETLHRFHVLRSTYFDFDALTVVTLIEEHARIGISYYMGKTAEEAASFQAMGFFEGLLEAAGAIEVAAAFPERSWELQERTILDLSWKSPAGA